MTKIRLDWTDVEELFFAGAWCTRSACCLCYTTGLLYVDCWQVIV